jgi:hypothetical protein
MVMDMDELKQLLLEQIRSRPDISSFHPLFSEELLIDESTPDDVELVSFTYRCVHTFATTDFGRFYGYRKGHTFRGEVHLEQDGRLGNLTLKLMQIFFSLQTNTDLESTDLYSKEYELKNDPLFTSLAKELHQASGDGAPEFCQFDTIFLDDIQDLPDGGKSYRIQYLFDKDGFSMYDKTATYEGTVILDAAGKLISLDLVTVRVGIGR